MKEVLKWRPYKDVKELLDCWYHKTGSCKANYQMPIIWLRDKSDGYVRQITGFVDDTVYVRVRNWTMEELFEEFEYIDGSPCGVYTGI